MPSNAYVMVLPPLFSLYQYSRSPCARVTLRLQLAWENANADVRLQKMFESLTPVPHTRRGISGHGDFGNRWRWQEYQGEYGLWHMR